MFTARPTRRLVPAVALLLACGGGDLVLPAEGEPAAIEVVSGNDQTGRVGIPLAKPIVGRVTDSQGRPVADAPVAFVFTQDATDATVAPDTATTDADGRASFRVVMGTRVGGSGGELRVSTAGGQRTLSAPVAFTAVSADANELVLVGGDDQSAPAGAVLSDPLVVQVTDAFGNPIPGVPIAWTTDGGGSVSQATTPTGEDGLASVVRTLGSSAGTQHASASAPGLAGSPVIFTHTAGAGAATVLERVSGDGQSALVGTALPDPLVVRARDGSGNPVAGLAVAWVAGSGGGSLAPATSTTDAEGIASTRWTLGSAAGASTATAVISGVGTVVFGATALPGTPPGMSIEAQPPPAAQHGIELSQRPVVQLREPDGGVRRQSGVGVSVSVVEGGATLRGTLERNTGRDGRVEFGGLALVGPPGSYTLAFAADGYTGATSSAIALARAGTTITIRSDDPDPSSAGAPVRVRYQVTSSGGTPTGDVRITSDDDASCTGTVAAGECTLTLISVGTRTLTAAYPGDTQFEGSADSEIHRVDAAPQPVLAIVTQPSGSAAAGQPLARQPVVQLRDAGGGDVRTAGIPVAVELASGGGTLGGTTTRVTGEDGRAGFTELSIGGATGLHILRFTAAGYTPATSEPIDVQPAGPASTTTTITSDDPDPSEIGQPVTVRFTVGASAGTPTGTVTVAASAAESCSASVADGACTLALIVPGDRTLTATYAGDGSFAGSSGTAGHTVRAAPPPPIVPSATASSVEVKDATVDLDRATEVVVTVRDANADELESVTVTLSASGSGTAIEPGAETTKKNGQARFTFRSSEAGLKTLTAVAGGVTLAQQPTIAVARATTATSIDSHDPDPSAVGEAVTVAFHVASNAGTPTGSVTVSSDDGLSCTGALADGIGSCSISLASAGDRTLTASYAGDETFEPSSDTKSHTVSAPESPPTGEADAFTGAEDEALVVPAGGVLGNDLDPDGDPIRATVEGGPAHGQLALAADGGFSYTPDPDFAGIDGFTYRVDDATLSSAPVEVRLTIGPVNDPPSFAVGPDQTASAAAGARSVPGWATEITPGPGDEQGQSLTFLVEVVTGIDLFTTLPAVGPDGTLTFTPAGTPGTAQLTVTARDGGGTAQGGVDTSPAQSASIELTAPEGGV